MEPQEVAQVREEYLERFIGNSAILHNVGNGRWVLAGVNNRNEGTVVVVDDLTSVRAAFDLLEASAADSGLR